jgi:tripartite-type tricarboxylate transporter receptor subunit TctC
MNLPRRQFLHSVVGAAALPVTAGFANAQSYPTRPVRIIVGFPAGGILDIFARLIGQWLSERLGKTFLVENRTGAASNIAAEAVATAAPDGHTLLLLSVVNAINSTLYGKLSFNLMTDIAPVACLFRDGPGVMVVSPSFPAKTVSEFINYAKSNPGKINMASSGSGSTPHLYGELFKMMAGVELVHVPYRSQPQALTDLIGGQAQVTFDPLANSLEHIRSGKLRALAVTTAARSPALPDTPAMREILPGYEASGWLGIGAPKNTPREIIEVLNREVNACLADAKTKARFIELGYYQPSPMSPSELGRFIAADIEKWGKVIRFSGAKAD